MTKEGLLDAPNAYGKDFVYAVLTNGMYLYFYNFFICQCNVSYIYCFCSLGILTWKKIKLLRHVLYVVVIAIAKGV
jgi:hypothetical protein